MSKPYFTKYLQLAKLFLCSRDIQVGDEVHHLPDTHPNLRFKVIEDLGEGVSLIEYTEHPKGLFIGNQREWLTSSLFKVIGEISPGALSYVKEGDEFDEYQIRGLKSYGGASDGKGEIDSKSPVEIVYYWYQIKCPNCGHFH